MTDPLVSVIIPTYNRAGIISRTIDNVFDQTYKNIEVIIVDDGSTDDTVARLREYGSRIRVVWRENAGPATARNRGVETARGEIIAFQDSDDAWLPQKIERQVALLEKAGNHVPCCICNATLISSDRPAITSFRNARLSPHVEEGLWLNAPQVLMDRFLLFNQTVAIRRAALDKTGGFDETLRYLEDADLALRLSLLGPFAFIREPLVVYHQGSVGSLAMEALKKEILLRENVLKTRERVYETVRVTDDYLQLRAPARRALHRARRELWIARLAQNRIMGAPTVSHVLQRAERYLEAIAARSPWYERMQVVPIPNKKESFSYSTTELRYQAK